MAAPDGKISVQPFSFIIISSIVATKALESVKELTEKMGTSIIGQEKIIERIVMVLLADGNLLLEGLPGLAKTRAITSLSKNLDAGLSRIQFTPDLLPSDITGTEVYQPESKEKFIFQAGPVFNNLILADEINRALGARRSSPAGGHAGTTGDGCRHGPMHYPNCSW